MKFHSVESIQNREDDRDWNAADPAVKPLQPPQYRLKTTGSPPVYGDG